MKALVTGGGGFLGQAIVRALLDRGASVRSFSRAGYDALNRLGVEQHRGSVVAGCDGQLHQRRKVQVRIHFEDADGLHDDVFR